MSLNRNDYVIVGYDLTNFRDVFYTDDWAWNEENFNTYLANQSKGEIQLFSDPMDGVYLYFGYIVSANDEYDCETVKIGIADMERQKQYVDAKLKQIGWNIPAGLPFQVICFAEYT